MELRRHEVKDSLVSRKPMDPHSTACTLVGLNYGHALERFHRCSAAAIDRRRDAIQTCGKEQELISIMEHPTNIPEAVATLIKLMVDHPEGVVVEHVPMNDGSSLRITVNPADIGKVIGKQGRTARSLRVLVAAMGMAAKQRISLDIQE
jgi:uncharacterized protein